MLQLQKMQILKILMQKLQNRMVSETANCRKCRTGQFAFEIAPNSANSAMKKKRKMQNLQNIYKFGHFHMFLLQNVFCRMLKKNGEILGYCRNSISGCSLQNLQKDNTELAKR